MTIEEKAAMYDTLVQFTDYDVKCSLASLEGSTSVPDMETAERVTFAALYAQMLVQAATAGRDQLMPLPLSQRLIHVCQTLERTKKDWVAKHPDVQIPQTIEDVRTWSYGAIVSMVSSPVLTKLMTEDSGKVLITALMMMSTMCDAAMVGKLGDADHLKKVHSGSIAAFAKNILSPEAFERFEGQMAAVTEKYQRTAAYRPGAGFNPNQN